MKPTAPDYNNFYDTQYYTKIPSSLSSAWYWHSLTRRLGVNESSIILDIGCGLGDWLAAAVQRGATISGIDISEKAVSFCQKFLPQGTFQLSSSERLQFPDNSFTLITCLGVLEHFQDPAAALAEMSRVLTVDGRVVILVPLEGFFLRKLGIYRGTRQVVLQEEARSREAWIQLFADAGFVCCDEWHDPHLFSKQWILQKGLLAAPLRLVVALFDVLMPRNCQYQRYFLLQRKHAVT